MIRGREQVGEEFNGTVSTTVVSLTVPDGATMMLLQIEDNPIRYRTDGSSPTSSTGILIRASSTVEGYVQYIDPQWDYRERMLNFKMIRQGSADAKYNVEYYR